MSSYREGRDIDVFHEVFACRAMDGERQGNAGVINVGVSRTASSHCVRDFGYPLDRCPEGKAWWLRQPEGMPVV